MFKWLAKIVVEKVVSLILLVLTVGLIILAWRWWHVLPSWHSVGVFLGGIAVWLAFATVLPWVTFFLVRWVERADSNWPAIGLLVFWAALDGLLAWWLAGLNGWPRVGQWTACGVAFCLGGLYNLIAANQIAGGRHR